MKNKLLNQLGYLFQNSLTTNNAILIAYEEVYKRLSFAKYLISPTYLDVSKSRILSKLVEKPRFFELQRYLTDLTSDETYHKFFFKGYSYPLYFPKSEPIYSVYLVGTELCMPDNPHFYEVEQTRVTKNDIVLDCGAAEGLFSYLISPRCKRVYAIEPFEKFVQTMKKTFHGRKNVSVLHMAVSNKTQMMNVSEKGIGSIVNEESKGPPVQVTTIDDYFYKKSIPVSYIKADVEGEDFAVLQGAKKTIKKYKPKIAFTTYHRVDHADKMMKFLKSVEPSYHFLLKGVFPFSGVPMVLHAWCE